MADESPSLLSGVGNDHPHFFLQSADAVLLSPFVPGDDEVGLLWYDPHHLLALSCGRAIADPLEGAESLGIEDAPLHGCVESLRNPEDVALVCPQIPLDLLGPVRD